MVTLIIVPVVYALFTRKGSRSRKLATYSDFDFMDENGNNHKSLNQ
jgi:hypothetical protein